MESKILIIDGAYIPFVACCLKKDSNGDYPEKEWIDVKSYMDNMVEGLFIKTGRTEYIGYIDNNFKVSYRLKINPDYKGNRKAKPYPKWMKEAREYLISNWKFHPVEGIEADDAVYITMNELGLDKTIGVAVDKDLINLSGTWYNPKLNTAVTTDIEDQLYYFARSLIVGDPADNIKGIINRGEAYAKKFLESISKDGVFTKDPLVEIFNLYITTYGEVMGIREFHKNYTCLKVLSSLEELPKGVEFKIPE